MCEAVNYGIDPGMLAINVWELLVSQKKKKKKKRLEIASDQIHYAPW